MRNMFLSWLLQEIIRIIIFLNVKGGYGPFSKLILGAKESDLRERIGLISQRTRVTHFPVTSSGSHLAV
uniref:Uncharacterized protein n=1 Tax=Anguilla anguilla TaxID=7936 RepID=A0A0E9PWU7_ANGAN